MMLAMEVRKSFEAQQLPNIRNLYKIASKYVLDKRCMPRL